MLTLLLVVALLIVAMAAIVPSIAFQIRRDREEELIHRGVQYSRAIRAYFKKFGRYPTKLEDLESSNNLRFLRKRYKDPIDGRDFKLLHFGEAKSMLGAAVPVQGANQAVSGGFGSPNGPGVASAPSGFGASTTTPNSNAQPAAIQTPEPDQTKQAGTTVGQTGGQQVQSGNDRNEATGPVFGGGAVVGVVSTSKKESIREFNHKKKYTDWEFVYDPVNDRGGLLSTPNQPGLQGAGNQLGQQPQQNQNNSPFSSQPPPGMLNNPNSNPPPSNPQQQQ